MQGGKFHSSFMHTGKKNLPSLLERFEKIYTSNAEYHDLFIVAKGRDATRCSFEIIGFFFHVKITRVGTIQTRRRSSVHDGALVARVPYVVSQTPRFFPWTFSVYEGFVDLHLLPRADCLVVVVHDDHVMIAGVDVLSKVLSVPILAPGVQILRRVHGAFVRFISERWF